MTEETTYTKQELIASSCERHNKWRKDHLKSLAKHLFFGAAFLAYFSFAPGTTWVWTPLLIAATASLALVLIGIELYEAFRSAEDLACHGPGFSGEVFWLAPPLLFILIAGILSGPLTLLNISVAIVSITIIGYFLWKGLKFERRMNKIYFDRWQKAL